MLGAIAFDRVDALGTFRRVAAVLRSIDFVDSRHVEIFRAMGVLESKTQAPIAPLLAAYFGQDKIHQVGGAQYLGALEFEPAVVDPVAVAQALASAAKRRRVVTILEDYAIRTRENGQDVGTLVADIAAQLTTVAGEPSTEATRPKHGTFVDIIEQWRQEGQIQRVPTGIPTLDRACNGGLPLPRRILIIGAPSAGKTYTEIWLAHKFAFDLAAEGYRVAIMAVDEDPSDITARVAQMRGFTPEEIESREPAVLDAIQQSLGTANVRFYDDDQTIEDATADLVAWAKQTDSRCVLCVDSIHTVRSMASDFAKSNKEFVDGNCKALKAAHLQHKVTIIATGEMARGQYATEKSASDSNAMAAAADSRLPEFWAQTLLRLTTPKDCGDIVRVDIAKNRGPKNQKDMTFWLHFDRDHHDFHEVGDPDTNPDVVARRKVDQVTAKTKANAADALALARFIENHQGLNDSQLRTKVSADPTLGWGTGRLRTAVEVLANGGCTEFSYWNETAGKGRPVIHFVQRNQ